MEHNVGGVRSSSTSVCEQEEEHVPSSLRGMKLICVLLFR